MNRFKLVHDEYEMKHYIVDTLTKNTNKKVVFESEDENLADEIRVLLNTLNDELIHEHKILRGREHEFKWKRQCIY